MPHLDHDNDELDTLYPTLHAPAEVDDDHEVAWDSWDKVYQRGLEIIEEVKETMLVSGRRRHEQHALDSPQPQRTPTCLSQQRQAPTNNKTTTTQQHDTSHDVSLGK